MYEYFYSNKKASVLVGMSGLSVLPSIHLSIPLTFLHPSFLSSVFNLFFHSYCLSFLRSLYLSTAQETIHLSSLSSHLFIFSDGSSIPWIRLFRSSFHAFRPQILSSLTSFHLPSLVSFLVFSLSVPLSSHPVVLRFCHPSIVHSPIFNLRPTFLLLLICLFFYHLLLLFYAILHSICPVNCLLVFLFFLFFYSSVL